MSAPEPDRRSGCSRCGSEIREEARYCTACGAALASRCGGCGFEHLADERFCGGCGLSLVPQLLATAIGAAGERRKATVIFSDLSGYTALHERLDPEEVEGLISHIKAEAVRIVTALGGTVNQFIGDEVVSLFGIERTHEDDAWRAVRAALDLHAMVREMSPQVVAWTGQHILLHTGIDTGLVVTDPSDQRSGTIGIYGEPMIVGARLASHAVADAILLSPQTRSLLEGSVDSEPLEPVVLKGRSKPIVPHRVRGLLDRHDRFHLRSRRGLAPLVGREGHLARLREALATALAGEGRFVTVVGEAGAGKSRLIHEFRLGLDRSRVDVLEGRCLSTGSRTPWLPFLDVLRTALGLQDGEDPEVLRRQALEGLRAIDPELRPWLPHCLHLLSIPAGGEALPPGLQGEALRQALEAALAAVLTRRSRRRPLVLLLEDWHWSDEASEGGLRHLLTQLSRSPLLVVALHRHERLHQLEGLEPHLRLVLEGLAPAESRQVLAAVLEAWQVPDDLVARIQERTGGNPFFIEEIGRTLLEEGALRRCRPGQVELAGRLEDLRLPLTVEAVLQARLDRLDPEAREWLRIAAVVGREFSARLLAAVRGLDQGLEGTLERLCQRELIEPISPRSRLVYRFCHVLAQEATYQSILRRRRRQLHGAVARALERLHEDPQELGDEALAHHFRLSDAPARAVPHLEKAADRAFASCSIREARLMYRQAVEILENSPIGAQDSCTRIDLTLKWAQASHFAASCENVTALEFCLSVAEAMADEARAARITYWLGRLDYMLGRPLRAAMHFERCMAISRSMMDSETYALSFNFRGRICYQLAEHDRGIRILVEGIPLLEELGDREEQAYSLSMLAGEYSLVGEFGPAFEVHGRALAIYADSGNVVGESAALNRLALSHAFRGEWSQAIEVADRCVGLAGDSGIVLVLGMISAVRGYCQILRGQGSTEGLEQIERGIARIEAGGSLLVLSRLYAWAAEVRALLGDADGAKTWSLRALELVALGDRYGEVPAHRSRAMAAVLADPPDRATALHYLSLAEHCANISGERPELAITLFRRAEIHWVLGEPATAGEMVGQAMGAFASMGMEWWLAQARRLTAMLENGTPFRGFLPGRWAGSGAGDGA